MSNHSTVCAHLMSGRDDETAYWNCRVLLPIVRSRRYWEGILVTPRFLMVAPAWQGAVTYLMSLTGGSCIGILLLLASQLRLIMRGQTYVESLVGSITSQADSCPHICHCGLSYHGALSHYAHNQQLFL